MNNETAFSRLARELIKAFADSRRIHANTLLLSVYGDTICSFGGTIWLGSLIELVRPLGLNDRLVRTTVYRLAERGILCSQQVGRSSYYALTERGLRQFQSASKRIYAPRLPDWDGGWDLVITEPGNLDTEQRELIRKELIWLGFSRISNGLYAHPCADHHALQTMLEDRGFHSQVALFHATAVDPKTKSISNRLITKCFDTTTTDKLYREFSAIFEPILEAARQSNQLNLELCFQVRTLLIHKYRMILLREPELPQELLPDDAIGQYARTITAELYQRLSAQSDSYFLRIAQSVDGAFRQPAHEYYQRFRGNAL